MAEPATIKQVKEYLEEGEGYPPVENQEILSMKREDPEGYDEIKRLVGEELQRRNLSI